MLMPDPPFLELRTLLICTVQLFSLLVHTASGLVKGCPFNPSRSDRTDCRGIHRAEREKVDVNGLFSCNQTLGTALLIVSAFVNGHGLGGLA